MILEKETSKDIEYLCYKNNTTKRYKGFKKKDFDDKVWVSQESLKELCEDYSHDKISWVKFLEEVGFDIKELKGE